MKEEIYAEPAVARPPAFLFRRVSWGAIWAGFFVTIVVQLLFTSLGLAIGSSLSHSFFQSPGPSQNVDTGAAVWMLITGLISLFVGACVAGRLSGGPRRADGMLHGIVTWSISTLAMLAVITAGIGMSIGGLGRLISDTVPSLSQSSLAVNEQQTSPQAGASLSPTGRQASSPEADQAKSSGSAGASPGGLSGTWWSFIALALGIIVAAWGGWAGTSSLPMRIEERPAVNV